MNPDLLHILRHSLGLATDGSGNPYRNHFVTTATSADGLLCQQLVASGHMRDHGPTVVAGGMNLYTVLPAGSTAAFTPRPPTPLPGTREKASAKRRLAKARYQRFMKYGDLVGNFREFLTWDAQPERSWNS